jgi:hypothetical protein
VGFAFGAALLERLQPAFVGPGQRNRQPLRKQVITGVSRRYLDLVGLAAQTNDVVS